MNKNEIIYQLKQEFPGRPIICIPEENSEEIVCEVEINEYLDHSVAVAYIKKSEPHYHEETLEVYFIERGSLTLHIGEDTYILEEGSVFIINTGKVHWAEGDWTRMKVVATPPWSPNDHILAEK